MLTRFALALACIVIGSLAGCGGPAPAAAVPVPPATANAPVAPTTASPEAALARRFQDCWALFEAAKWAEVEGCYAPGAVYEVPGLDARRRDLAAKIAEAQYLREAAPDSRNQLELVIVAGSTVIAVARAPAAGGGARRFAEIVEYGAQGQATTDTVFVDAVARPRASGDALSPAPEVVVAQAGDAERANAATVEALLAAWRTGDPAGFAAVIADGATWFEPALERDLDKPGALALLAERKRGFRDHQLVAQATWFAGSYAVVRGQLEGENDGELPALGVRRTRKRIAIPALAVFRIDGGKLTAASVFWQSAAIAKQLGSTAKRP